jgi:hypothetical protein
LLLTIITVFVIKDLERETVPNKVSVVRALPSTPPGKELHDEAKSGEAINVANTHTRLF